MAVAVWNRFSNEHEIEITSRAYAETNDVLSFYKIPFDSYGYFHGETDQKFRERIKRLEFLFENHSAVDAIITQAAVETVHMGVGLGKPVVVLTDAPKRKYLNRQIIPSATYHLREELTRNEWEYEPDKPIYMDACQEHFYTKPITQRNPNLVVYRNFETHASYAVGVRPPDILELVKKFCKDHGFELLELQRYTKHEFAPPEEIFSKVVMVITGGSSMAIEATLLQIPAASFYPNYFPKFEYLIEKGYPFMRILNAKKLTNQLEELLQKKPTQHKFTDYPLDKMKVIMDDIQANL